MSFIFFFSTAVVLTRVWQPVPGEPVLPPQYRLYPLQVGRYTVNKEGGREKWSIHSKVGFGSGTLPASNSSQSSLSTVPSPTCPPGVPMVYCFIDPCSSATCANHPNATCVSNYCGGCNYNFYDRRGADVTASCCKYSKSTCCMHCREKENSLSLTSFRIDVPFECSSHLALSPDHSQVLSHSRGESESGLGMRLPGQK